MEPTIAAYNFCNPDFDAFLEATTAAGFSHVALGFCQGYLDLALEDLSAADEQRLRDKLADHGLALAAVYSSSNLLADDGLELLQRKLEGAARFGVGLLDTGGIHLDADPAKRAQDVAAFVDRIRRAGDFAGQRGLTICLETHGGYTGHADACLQAMATINHERVRLAFDPANFLFYEGRRPEERLAELIPFIGHTHLKDHRGGKGRKDFPPLGRGEVHYDRLLPALWRGGYRGPYTLERAVGDNNQEKAAAMKAAHQFITNLLG